MILNWFSQNSIQTFNIMFSNKVTWKNPYYVISEESISTMYKHLMLNFIVLLQVLLLLFLPLDLLIPFQLNGISLGGGGGLGHGLLIIEKLVCKTLKEGMGFACHIHCCITSVRWVPGTQYAFKKYLFQRNNK